MPLDRSATQTTATNSATYLVNKRRRVFGTRASLGACCSVPSPGAALGFETKKRLMKLRVVIFATVSGLVAVRPVQASPSFDDLVREREQGRRHLEAKHSSRFDIDGQLEFGWCLCRQITRIGTFQDAIDIRGRATKNISGLWSVGDQRTFASKLRVGEDRRKTMLRCRADDQIAMYDGIGIRRNEQATAGVAAQFGDSPFDFGWVNYGSRLDLQRTRRRNSLERAQKGGVVRRGRWIEHDGHPMHFWRELRM